MSDRSIYNQAKSFYLVKYVHDFLCFALLVLNILLFVAVLFIIFPKLYIYGSLYYIYRDVLGIAIVTSSSVGVFIVIFGYVASLKKNYVALTLYGSILFLILLVDITIIIIYVSFGHFKVFECYSAKEMISHFNSLQENYSRNLINNVQQNLQCCGLNGPADYKNGTVANVPISCCPNKECKNILSIYLSGCLETFLNYPVPGSVFIYSVFLTLVIVKILSMLTTLKYVIKIIDFSKESVLQSL